MVVSDGFREAISRRRLVAFSTDLVNTLDREENGETPFTPPVQTMYALREALRELLEEGVSARIAKYQDISESLRNGLAALELSFLVPRQHLSNTMTTVMLPEGMTYAGLHGPWKEQGYLIYKSQGNLSETTGRLGTVGIISRVDVQGFLSALGKLL